MAPKAASSHAGVCHTFLVVLYILGGICSQSMVQLPVTPSLGARCIGYHIMLLITGINVSCRW